MQSSHFAVALAVTSSLLTSCGKSQPTPPFPSAESAHVTCRYFIRKALPSGADIDWAPLDSTAASQQADEWRVVVMYRVANQGGARSTACRLRALPDGQWKLLTMD